MLLKKIKDNTSKLLIFSFLASIIGAITGILASNLIVLPLKD